MYRSTEFKKKKPKYANYSTLENHFEQYEISKRSRKDMGSKGIGHKSALNGIENENFMAFGDQG